MFDMNFKLDSSETEFEDIFFNRPVSRIHASSIGLVCSRNVALKTINTIYQIITALNHRVILVADENKTSKLLPADVLLKSKKTLGYQNVDDDINELERSKIIILLAGKELNSAMELFMNQLLKVYKGTIITDKLSIIHNTEFEGKGILIADSQNLSAKYDSGLNHIANLTLEYSKENRCPIVFLRPNQVICTSHQQPGVACVVSSKKTIIPEEYIAFMAGLMADKKIPLELDWLRYCQAAGYLMRKMNTSGLASVKKYLDDKF